MESTDHFSSSVKPDSTNSDHSTDRRKLITLASLGIAGLLFSRKSLGQNPSPKPVSSSEAKKAGPVNALRYVPTSKPINKATRIVDEPEPKPVNMQRSPAAEAEWVRLEDELKKVGITYNNLFDTKLNNHFTSIHDGFLFEPQPLDEQFVETHVEPLIDQAADLLDRCLRDRAAWDESSHKLFILLQEVREFRSLDKIHTEEQQAGVYNTPYKTSLALYKSEEAYLATMRSMRKSLDATFVEILNNKRIEKVHEAVTSNAFLGGLPAYKLEGQNYEYIKYKLKPDGAEKEAYKLYTENSGIISKYDLDLQVYGYEFQLYSTNAQIALSDRRLAGLKAQMDWERNNVAFQQRRTIVARDINDFKAKAILDPNGVLNYVKRLKPLKERFDRDFRDALARMTAVEKGLKSLYGYDFPRPKNQSAVDYYDQCLLWTRQVIQWVLKFSRNEQNTILPISLKQVLTQSQFNAIKESGSFTFDLLEAHFPAMVNVRLRGLSVYVEENQASDNRIWKAKITPPITGKITHYLTKGKVDFDQSFLEPCFLGRISARQPGKMPDVVGITSLYNASPIGKWKLDLLGAIPLQEPKKIDDIIIDLQLAFRWA